MSCESHIFCRGCGTPHIYCPECEGRLKIQYSKNDLKPVHNQEANYMIDDLMDSFSNSPSEPTNPQRSTKAHKALPLAVAKRISTNVENEDDSRSPEIMILSSEDTISEVDDGESGFVLNISACDAEIHNVNDIDEEKDKQHFKDDVARTSAIKKAVTKAPVSIFEKRMKTHYKVKDLRERSFLIVCDENRMIDYNALYQYIEYFAEEKPSSNKVREFFDYMKSKSRNAVTFFKFVSVIAENGDIIAAYKRFLKTQ